MAIYDRWYLTKRAPDGSRIRSTEYGCEKRWQVRYRDTNGKQRKRNFAKKEGKDPARHAAAFDAKITAELNAGTYIDPDAGQVTLRSRTELWRAGLTSDASTLETIDKRLHWITRAGIADNTMAELSKHPSMMQAWIKSMEPHLSAGAIRNVFGDARAIFNAAVDDGIIVRNPLNARSVRRPSVPKKKIVPWTLQQVEAAWAALPGRYAAIPVLVAGCGHRQGEAFGIAVEDVDFLGREVHIVRQVRIIRGRLVFSPPKGGKTRTVPLSEAVALRLSAHIAKHPPVEVELPWVEQGNPNAPPVKAWLLFTTARRNAIYKNSFNAPWRQARIAAGVKDSRENGLHVLRHTAASAWLAHLVDIRTVAEYLGHEDPGFTLRTYSHLMPNAADRARKAMDAFFEQSALDVPSDEAK